jgi:exonuclease III
MLINKNLSPEIIEIFKDQDENILLCATKLNGAELILGSIYGPNNTDRNFYRNLENFIEKYPNWPVVLGGDWNTTWCNERPEENVDIYAMARSPNMANGKLLKALAEKYGLTDPFRVLYPTKNSFSYSPFGNTRHNKSRIDFF